MVTSDGKLRIFENFIIDSKLKQKSEFELNEDSGTSFIISNSGINLGENSVLFEENVKIIEYLEYVYQQNRTILNWLKLHASRIFLNVNKVKKNVIKYQLVDDFFREIHNSVKTLNINPSSISFYTDAIKQAVENGQQALSEILASRKNSVLNELALLNARKNVKYVDESDVVSFYNKTKETGKYLKLTWIKNYTRVIPLEVISLKKEFDKLFIFDNYVVLHFDKTGDSTQMTNKEKEKAKDPILFGVMRDSRKLFYIGDWIDEYCDLTLDKFINVLEQKKTKELTQKSIENDVLGKTLPK